MNYKKVSPRNPRRNNQEDDFARKKLIDRSSSINLSRSS